MNASQQILAIVDAAVPPVAPALPPPREKKLQASQQGGAAETMVVAEGKAAADHAAPQAAPASIIQGEVPPARNDEEMQEERRREEEERRRVLNPELAELPMTDLGNAERFRKRFGHLFRYCKAIGWLYWDERRWARKGAEERMLMAAHETARAIQDEAKACYDKAQAIADEIGQELIDKATAKKKAEPKGAKKKRGKKPKDPLEELTPAQLEKIGRYKRLKLLGFELSEWGRASEMNARLMPIDDHAAPYLAVDINDLDADHWKINFINCTLVVDREAKTITARPHDPKDLITKLSTVEVDPKAVCPQFDKFFERVQEPADRRFLLQWFGYGMTGDNGEQKLVMMHGAGRNGKGVLVRICQYVAGDYAKVTPVETFLAEGNPRNASQPTPERAALPGVRALFTDEPDKGSVLNVAFIKLVTGGDKVSARELNKPQFEFEPIFKLTISGNHKPTIKDQTESIWARVQFIPWTVIIPKEERDPQLDAKLRREASGVLNRLLAGLADWMASGLVMSERAEKATQEYREESDQLGRWLKDCVRPAPGKRVQSTVAHELFVAWSKATGAAEWKNAGFTNAMKDRGYETFKSSVMYFLDIELTKNVSDFVDHEGKPIVEGRAPAAPQPLKKKGESDDEIAF